MNLLEFIRNALGPERIAAAQAAVAGPPPLVTRREAVWPSGAIRWSLAYAYSPRENVGSRGATHAVLDAPLEQGRFKRRAGDALCKPALKFWGLNLLDWEKERKITCKTCLRAAKRHGLGLVVPQTRMVIS